jgi:hypothetical protein
LRVSSLKAERSALGEPGCHGYRQTPARPPSAPVSPPSTPTSASPHDPEDAGASQLSPGAHSLGIVGDTKGFQRPSTNLPHMPVDVMPEPRRRSDAPNRHRRRGRARRSAPRGDMDGDCHQPVISSS